MVHVSTNIVADGRIEINTQSTYQHRTGHLAIQVTGKAGARDVIVAVDTSGSMGGIRHQKIIQQIVTEISSQLSHQDQIAVLTYNTRCQTVVPLQSHTTFNLRADFWQTRSFSRPSNLGTALCDCFTHLSLTPASRKPVVILVTNGHPSQGITSHPGILKYIQARLVEQPRVSISAIGIGCDCNQKLLSSMTQLGSGQLKIVTPTTKVSELVECLMGHTVAPSYQKLLLSVNGSDKTIVNQSSIPIERLAHGVAQTWHVLFTPITGYEYQDTEPFITLQLDYTHPETYEWLTLQQEIIL